MTLSIRLTAVVFVLALASSGCGLFGGSRAPEAPGTSGPGSAADTATLIELEGQHTMNAGGNAARVYLYPLSSQSTFLATPVQVFWNDPAATLGSDLVGAARDATVRPDETATLADIALGTAAFLGIAVDLRTPEGTSWRTALPASDVRGKTLRVTVGETGLRVTSH